MWLILVIAAAAQDPGLAERLQECSTEEDSLRRLACYDALGSEADDAAEPLDSIPPAAFDIATALERGLGGKSAGLRMADTLAAFGTTSGFSLQVHSPATWVQQLGYEGSEKYMQLTPDDLAPEDTRDLLRVVVFPDTPEKMSSASLASDVEHVVVQDAEQEEAIQPLLIEPFTESLSNLFGAQLDYAGVTAIFDMREVQRIRDLDGKQEFHITVVGSKSDKSFKVKTKHFDDLGWEER